MFSLLLGGNCNLRIDIPDAIEYLLWYLLNTFTVSYKSKTIFMAVQKRVIRVKENQIFVSYRYN